MERRHPPFVPAKSQAGFTFQGGGQKLQDSRDKLANYESKYLDIIVQSSQSVLPHFLPPTLLSFIKKRKKKVY